MKIEKVTVNGQDVTHYIQIIDGFIKIPLESIYNTDPIRGQIAVGYFCKNEQGPKKWKVEIRTKRLAQLLKTKPYLSWYETRREAENHINSLDKELSF